MMLPTIKDATDRLRFLNLPQRLAQGMGFLVAVGNISLLCCGWSVTGFPMHFPMHFRMHFPMRFPMFPMFP